MLVFAAIGIAVSAILRRAAGVLDEWSGVPASGNEASITLAVIGAHFVMLRWVDRRPWSYVWLGDDAAGRRQLLFGAMSGALPIAAASLALLAMGWLTIESYAPGSWIVAALKITSLLAPAAFFEEMLSRGYIFAALKD